MLHVHVQKPVTLDQIGNNATPEIRPAIDLYITCVICVIWNDEDHWGGFHWFIQDADTPNEDGELTQWISNEKCPK